jgi:cation diffusion facilitator CzcD-associated flavoprotein CzcO
MFLKSEPYGSDFSTPTRGYEMATFAKLHGLDDYRDRVGPLSRERLVEYGDWFTRELVPDIRDITVTSVTQDGGGFKVEFAEESPMLARSVIIATGLMPYMHIPEVLSGLPSELLTHTSEHQHFDQFRGKRVVVIGGGQSGLQTGALLHEAGADAQVIVRKQNVEWDEQIAQEIGWLDYLLRPPVKLCEGWGCVFYDSPTAFRLLPESVRINRARTQFGPAGAWWLRDRVEGVVDVLTGHPLKSAAPKGSGVRLELDGPERSFVEADHVIAGTGFRIDVSRLPFMSEGIVAGLRTAVGCAVVDKAGESSVPGLYFTGAHTMTSLGPGARFISGTHHSSARLAGSVARRTRRGGRGEAASSADSRRSLAGAGTGPHPVL